MDPRDPREPRKRHAPSRSRGNSPPNQRRRESEQSLTRDTATPSAPTDRYGNSMYHGAPPSPPHSRRISSSSLPTRPMLHAANERQIDQSRREAVNSRRSHADQSPMHVISPASIRSGSSTPLIGAPTVPSMLPVAQKPAASRHMDTLNILRTQRLANAAATSHNPESSSNTTEVRGLKAQLKARELQDTQLRSEVKELKGSLLRLQNELRLQEQAAAKASSVETLERRLAILEGTRSSIETQQSGHATTLTNLSTQLQTLQARMDKVESNSANVKDDLQLRLETFETGVTKVTEQHLSCLRQRQESHMKEVAEFIGPIRQAYSDADQATIVQRISSLEETCKSLLEKQDDALSQIKSISTKSIVNPTDFTLLQNTVKNHLDEQQKLTENFETRFTGLSTRVEAIEANLLTLPERGGDGRHAVVGPQSTETEMRLGELEQRVAGSNGIQDLIEQLKVRTEVNERSFVKILQEKFDSFEASTDDKLAKSSEWVAGLHEQSQASKQELLQKIHEVKQGLSDLQDTTTQKMSEVQEYLSHLQNDVNQNLDEVQQSLFHLQNDVSTEMEHRKAAVEDIKQQLGLKQDTAAATKATDNVKLAVRNLQAQYENISTDDLFQKMSGWILQQYPTSSADTLQQLAAVRHDLARVRSFTDSFTHIPNSAQALVSLANLSSQIIALVRTPLGSIQSPETRAKYDRALGKMESFEEAISSLQRSLHTLKSENSPFVKKESWKPSMDTLQAHIDGRIEEELKARSALEQQVKATGLATQEFTVKMETRFRECLETLNNTELVSNQRFERLETALEILRTDTKQLRLHVDDELKDFNVPAKRECFNELPALFVHVTQLQIFVENLNQNSHGLEYKWACDFEKKYGIPSPFPSSRDILAGDP